MKINLPSVKAAFAAVAFCLAGAGITLFDSFTQAKRDRLRVINTEKRIFDDVREATREAGPPLTGDTYPTILFMQKFLRGPGPSGLAAREQALGIGMKEKFCVRAFEGPVVAQYFSEEALIYKEEEKERALQAAGGPPVYTVSLPPAPILVADPSLAASPEAILAFRKAISEQAPEKTRETIWVLVREENSPTGYHVLTTNIGQSAVRLDDGRQAAIHENPGEWRPSL